MTLRLPFSCTKSRLSRYCVERWELVERAGWCWLEIWGDGGEVMIDLFELGLRLGHGSSFLKEWIW